MAFAANAINLLGLVLLVHAVYSAHEYSLTIPSTAQTPTAGSTTSTTALKSTSTLPLDITLETLISVLLLCIGVVLSAPELKPIQWRVWAGKLEREKRKTMEGLDAGFVENPYRALEERGGFLDIRARRREFAAWVREGGAR